MLQGVGEGYTGKNIQGGRLQNYAGPAETERT